MYRNLDECLKDVYRFGALRIEPMGNTAQICHWVENKGVSRGGGHGMTQHDWHANAAMIQARIERLLDRFELATVEMEYGAVDLHNIVDLSLYVLQQHQKINMLLCDSLIAHHFTGRPRRVDIMDRYDLSNGKFYRQYGKVAGCLNGLLNKARLKADCHLRECGVISEKISGEIGGVNADGNTNRPCGKRLRTAKI